MLRTIAALLVLVLLWQLLSLTGWLNPLFMASPAETWKAGAQLARDGALHKDVLHTLYRALAGVGVSVGVGIPLGIAVGYSERAFRYVEGVIDFFRSIPPVIVFPLALLIFGIGEGGRVAVVIFGCSTVMLLNVSLGVRNLPEARG